jgi:hypothetical protein
MSRQRRAGCGKFALEIQEAPVRGFKFGSSLLSATLLLGACASDATFTMAGRAPDPQVLEADASDCSSFWPVVGTFLVGAAYGAAEGAIIGASSGGADVGAVIGAGAGGVIGLAIGAAYTAAGDGYESCMAKKGYAVAAVPNVSAPIAAAAPKVETASRPALQSTLDDPAR